MDLHLCQTFAISSEAEFAKLELGKRQIESAILGFSGTATNLGKFQLITVLRWPKY